MSHIHSVVFSRTALLIVVLLCCASPLWGASNACNLLPANIDVIVTVNPRELFHDCGQIPPAQRYLEQWRLAAKGDEQLLSEYYETQEIHKYEGISQKDFLDQCSLIKIACEAFGADPFKNIDSITCGYDSKLVRVPRRNHNSLLFSAITPEDPVSRAIMEFVRK